MYKQNIATVERYFSMLDWWVVCVSAGINIFLIEASALES